MQLLNFEFYSDRYKGLIESPNAESRAAGMVHALDDHQLAVRVGLMNFTSQALATAYKLTNKKAQQYMMYGVGRRLRMMDVSYRGIFDTVAADRKEPLPLADIAAVSRDLNIVYINIRGALDNYAWCLYHEWGMGKGGEFKEGDVGLFLKKFCNDDRLAKLKSTLDSHNAWNIDLKGRRDPSAHRMPLYVPPAILNEEQAARHQAIWKERNEAIEKGDYDLDTKLADEQSRLGVFSPHFLHDPDHDGYPIYRTVPDDVGKLIAIGTAIHGELVPPPGADA